MLVAANGSADQKYTNRLLYNGTAVTSGAAYSITETPARITNQITVNSDTGEVSFGKPLYDKMTPSDPTQATGPPQRVTVQAAYQGKTASYTFTVTDHFSPREAYSSVVVGDDIYVMGGVTRKAQGATSLTTPPTPAVTAVQSNEVWRSSDGGITWDQVAKDGSRFTPRGNHASAVLGSGGSAELYVIGGVGGNSSATPLDDVWKSTDRGVNWVKVTPSTPPAGTFFPMDDKFTSAVLGNTIYVMGGIQRRTTAPRRTRLNQVWSSTAAPTTSIGAAWGNITGTSTPFPKRSGHTSVVLESGSGGVPELYVIGGTDIGDKNDVWSSPDGTNWTEVTASATSSRKFTAREGHSSAVVGSDIYVIGGSQSGSLKNDVWKSVNNGAAWSRVTVNSASSVFSARQNHGSVVLGGALYVIGGRSATGGVRGFTLLNDVWKSTDGGENWVNVHKN